MIRIENALLVLVTMTGILIVTAIQAVGTNGSEIPIPAPKPPVKICDVCK